ncbi:MAG: KdsC family phosphatase [Lachnospiraceae bacterium]
MADIKLLVLDVDGTMTDGKVYIGESGELFKAFDIKDGLGIHNILPKNGIIPAIITGRKSAMLEKRCQEIGISHLYQGVSDKVSCLNELLKDLGLTCENCAYMGDDINDIACMEKVAVVGCPADAVDAVKKIADYVASRNGGSGAVREFIEWLCRKEV